MNDLVCIIHDQNDYDSCITFNIDDDLIKNIKEYLFKKYGKTAKSNNNLIGLIFALTLKEYTKGFHIAKYNLIVPTYYNWIDGCLYIDVSRETNLTKITPFKYIKNNCKLKNVKKYESLLVKIFTDVNILINSDIFYVDDTDNKVNNIYHMFYHYLENIVDQYTTASIGNIDFQKEGVIAQKDKINELIKTDINDFISSTKLNLKKTIVRIDRGENIDSTKFTYGSDPESYYYFDETGGLCRLNNLGYNLFE